MTRKGKKILLFDLYDSGHHLQYITYLVRYWLRERPAGQLHVAVPAIACKRNASLVDWIRGGTSAGVHLQPLPLPVRFGRGGIRGLIQDDLEHGRQLRRLVETVQPDHAVLMYFDQAQLSLALDLRFTSRLALSGIYFRPSFHYPRLTGYRPSTGERATNLRKQFMLRAAIRNPHFQYLFCLDPFVIDHLPQSPDQLEPEWLPDGVDCAAPSGSSDAFRSRWKVDPHRQLVSLFGVLDQRKGVIETARAVSMLSSDHQATLCLALFGPLDRSDNELDRALREIEAQTRVQLIIEDRFIPHEESQALLEASSLILLPYRRHVGSSNVLVRAACAGRPVLGSDYGALGMQIRKNQLGRTVPTERPERIAQALAAFLSDSASIPFDPVKCRAFAEANGSEAFANTIFRRLLS